MSGAVWFAVGGIVLVVGFAVWLLVEGVKRSREEVREKEL